MLSFNITPAERFSLKQASASCGCDINAAIINIYVFWPCFLFSDHLKVIAAAEFISQGEKKLNYPYAGVINLGGLRSPDDEIEF